MNHQDHVHLLRKGVATSGGLWTDFGCGTGAFTLALADVLGPTGSVYAVDKDRGALDVLQRTMQTSFPAITLYTLRDDFTHPLELPMLDGIVMANSLHFVRKKDALLQQVHSYLRPGGACFWLSRMQTRAIRGCPIRWPILPGKGLRHTMAFMQRAF
jgi:ubiquinone/menaquinone biosynthesis C-methylase UbiE